MKYGTAVGPGGGSVPEFVMRTGSITPFNPAQARHDIKPAEVTRATRIPVGMSPGTLSGSDAFGRPVRRFSMPGSPSSLEAARAVEALKQTAGFMQKRNLTAIAPPLVGGPLAALARGEAVVLRWTNGVAISAAL